MPKRTIDYETWLSEELQDPEIAANYLSAAIDDSPQIFLEALKDVTQAHQVATVARKSGVKRESLYKAFSEDGNPTFDTLHSVLNVFGLKMRFEPSLASSHRHAPGGSTARVGRVIHRTKTHRAAAKFHAGQLALSFDNAPPVHPDRLSNFEGAKPSPHASDISSATILYQSGSFRGSSTIAFQSNLVHTSLPSFPFASSIAAEHFTEQLS